MAEINIKGELKFDSESIKKMLIELNEGMAEIPGERIGIDKRVTPPTVEFVGRPDPDRTTAFELIPLCIVVLSIGMAIGKYVI